MQSADNRNHEAESSPENSSAPAGADESLLDLIAAVITLVQQTWVDRFALARAEAGLAFRSLIVIGLLIGALALVLMVAWVIVLGGVAYYALLQGAHWLAVFAGLLLAQVVLVLLLVWQIKRLARWLSFPATRRAFSHLDELSEDDNQKDSKATGEGS